MSEAGAGTSGKTLHPIAQGARHDCHLDVTVIVAHKAKNRNKDKNGILCALRL
jgi:hypothetical protein